jgi:hypothetical protein
MRMSVSVLLGSLVLAATTSGEAVAQEVLYEFASPDEEQGGWFGAVVSGAGDVDNDGHPDLVVGAIHEDPGASPTDAGRAYVFSGATGDTLHTLASPNEEGHGLFGVAWGAGDVNNDGHADIAVGAEREDPGASPSAAGRAYVFSGATGDTLYTLASPNEEQGGHFGGHASGAGDVDNDGYPDVVVGAKEEDCDSTNAGRAYIFSGPTGALLHTLISPNQETDGDFASSVYGAGDVNNDGYADVVVGAAEEDPGTSPMNAGRAYVFSGATGDTIYTLVSPNEEEGGRFGYGVGGPGDVNNDGYADIAVGAPYENPGGSPNDAGRAYVFSGATGDTLYTLVSPNEEEGGAFGYGIRWAGDVNNDGHADVVVPAPAEDPGDSPTDAGRAYVFSGATGALLWTLVSPNEESQGYFGVYVSGAEDVNNDRYAEVIVGAFEAPGASPSNCGRAYVFSQMVLSGTLSGGELVLDWSHWPVAAAYWVYGADGEAYFDPQLITPYQYRLQILPSGTTTWSSPNGIGDPDHNWTYQVVAADASEREMCRSNRYGEHDFGMANE